MDFQEQAKNIIHNLDQKMSPSLYDAAWLLRFKTREGRPYKPDYLEWLLERQHADGSWGANIQYYHHDRIICTLIAAIAMTEQEPSPEVREAIKNAETYLWQHAHMLFRDPAFTELVGFELLFPTLMETARERGLTLPKHNFGMGDLQNEKLRLIPPEMLYSRNLTTVHSIEFLGPDVPAGELHNAVFENGSLGNSPSATAYYLMLCLNQNQTPEKSSLAYLDRVTKKYVTTNYLFPFRNFEKLWVVNNFAVTDGIFPIKEWLPDSFLDELQQRVEGSGVSLDDEFGIPDADCTSVAYYLLGLAGRFPDPAALAHFEVPGQQFFRTYFFERNLSVSTNIHALEALRLMPQYPEREAVMQKIKVMLLNSRRFKLFWTDKWHASPYYATAFALVALLDGNSESQTVCQDTIDWLTHAQRSDGSWGFFNSGTMEETAYALLALQRAYRYGLIEADVLRRGMDFLMVHLETIDPEADYEELWLGKCLYAPYDIIHSAVLAAILHHEALFGRLP